METSRLSSSLRFGITERGVIVRPRWTRFYYRLFNNQLYSECNMAVQSMERTQRTGEHLNKHIYLHTYTVGMHVNQCSNGNHAVMYAIKESTHAIMQHVRDKPRAMQKSYYRLLCTHLTVLLKDMVPQRSRKETRKNPRTDKGQTGPLGSLCPRSCVDRKGSARPCRLPSPSW